MKALRKDQNVRHWFSIETIGHTAMIDLVKEARKKAWQSRVDFLDCRKSFLRHMSDLSIDEAIGKLERADSPIPRFLSDNWFIGEGPFQVFVRFQDPDDKEVDLFIFMDLKTPEARRLIKRYGLIEKEA